MAFHTLVTVPQQRLAAERHISLALAAALELLTFVVVYLIVSSRFGRRVPLCTAQIIVAVTCLVIGVDANVQPPLIDWLGNNFNK